MMKKMMTNINFKIIKALFFVNLFLLLIEYIVFDMKYILPLEVGFISASLIVLASMKSYKKMVDTRIEENIITLDDDRDVLEKLEDPYDLYSPDIKEDEQKELVEVVKEQRDKLKSKRSIFEVVKDSKPALSLYRLGAYMVLILGFLYLNRHHQLHIITYIVALGIPSVISVFVLISQKENR